MVKVGGPGGGGGHWATDPARSCGRCKAELGRIINRGALCRYTGIPEIHFVMFVITGFRQANLDYPQERPLLLLMFW